MNGMGPRGAGEQVELMLARTVKIYASSCKGANGEAEGGHSGSGVILYTGVIATAKHVIDRDCVYQFEDANKFKVFAFRPKLHPKADVGILYTFGTGVFEPVEFAKPYLGEPIFALGHPHDLLKGRTWLTVTRGVVAARYENSLFRFTAPIYPGNSGGPIFDRRGKLVGIISAAMFRFGAPMDGMYYGVKSSYLLEVLHSQDGSEE